MVVAVRCWSASPLPAIRYPLSYAVFGYIKYFSFLTLANEQRPRNGKALTGRNSKQRDVLTRSRGGVANTLRQCFLFSFVLLPVLRTVLFLFSFFFFSQCSGLCFFCSRSFFFPRFFNPFLFSRSRDDHDFEVSKELGICFRRTFVEVKSMEGFRFSLRGHRGTYAIRTSQRYTDFEAIFGLE